MRRLLFGSTAWDSCFNPRICKRCDSPSLRWKRSSIRFNPRICKRCDYLNTFNYQFYPVSIHASVKDATLICVCSGSVKSFNPRICKRCDIVSRPQVLILDVSIHASVKDATSTNPSGPRLDLCFNPRICKRCDFPK